MKRPVGRPKAYVEQVSVLLEEGTKERMARARGDQHQADFLRDAIDVAIKKGRRKTARREQPE